MKVTLLTIRSLILICGLMASASWSSAATEPSVLGYQAWKIGRIDEAKSTLERLNQSEKSAAPTKSERKGDASRLQAQLKNGRSDQKMQQAQINLEIAQELTVNDYFVLYLSQFKQKEAFVEAAKKLSPEEAAELMMAYQKRLSAAEPSDLAPSSPNFGGSASLK